MLDDMIVINGYYWLLMFNENQYWLIIARLQTSRIPSESTSDVGTNVSGEECSLVQEEDFSTVISSFPQTI